MATDEKGTRLFVRGIGENEKEMDLEKLFTKLKGVSKVTNCEVVRDASTGLCKGFGYVTIHVDEEKTLNRCLKVYNGTKWKGNVLRVEIAKEHYMVKMRREWDMERQQIEQSEEDIPEVDERVEEVEDSTPSTLYICKERHPEMICVQVDLLEPFSTVNASGDSIQRRHLRFDNESSQDVATSKRKRGSEDSEMVSKKLKSVENVAVDCEEESSSDEDEEEKVIETAVKVHKENNSSSEEEESSSDDDEEEKVLEKVVNVHKENNSSSEEEEESSSDEEDDNDTLDEGNMFEHIQSMLENSENGIDAEELAKKLKGKVDSAIIATLLAD